MSTKENTTIESKEDSRLDPLLEQPVIAHFPERAVEKNRPVLPSTAPQKERWKLSLDAGRRSAFIFLVISLICFFILLVNHSKIKISNPVHNIELKDLKKELGENIALMENSEDENYIEEMKAYNEQLTLRIRQLDLYLREYYFGLKSKELTGGFILFLSILGLFMSIRATRVFEPETPTPQPDVEKGEEQQREKRLGRNVVIIFTTSLSLILCGLYFINPEKPGAKYQALTGVSTQEVIDPNKIYSAEEMAQNWPILGGASTNPVYSGTMPQEFSAKESNNLAWKTQIPMGGVSSPIVWGKQIFVTAANKGKRAIYAYDISSGKQKWSAVAKSDKSKGAPAVFEEYCYAASTPACDGHRVYAIFANGDLITTDFKGNIVWQKDLGIPENDFGHSSSLAIYQNQVIVQWDHAEENSGIYIFDGPTGEEKMKIDRSKFGAVWRSPLVYTQNNQASLIVSAEEVISYSLNDGSILWEHMGMEGEIGSSPMIHNGLIYSLLDDRFGVIDPSNKENIVKWATDEFAYPDIPNPVIKDNRIFTVDSGGEFSCLNIETGELVYEHSLNVEIYASLMIVGNQILAMGIEGDCFIIEADENEFKMVHEFKFDGPLLASPAYINNHLIIRSDKELFSFRGLP